MGLEEGGRLRRGVRRGLGCSPQWSGEKSTARCDSEDDWYQQGLRQWQLGERGGGCGAAGVAAIVCAVAAGKQELSVLGW